MNSPPQPTKKEIVTEFRTRGILDAARRLLQSRGVESVTMEEIAAAAGVAKGTIYLYFQGKEDLIQDLITQVGEQMLADIEAIVQGSGTPLEKIQQVASLLLDYLMRERALFPAYARDLFSYLEGLKVKWVSHASLNIAENDELLSLAAKSGCHGLFIGFESLSQETLKSHHKTSNLVERYKEQIRKIHGHIVEQPGLAVLDLRTLEHGGAGMEHDGDLEVLGCFV